MYPSLRPENLALAMKVGGAVLTGAAAAAAVVAEVATADGLLSSDFLADLLLVLGVLLSVRALVLFIADFNAGVVLVSSTDSCSLLDFFIFFSFLLETGSTASSAGTAAGMFFFFALFSTTAGVGTSSTSLIARFDFFSFFSAGAGVVVVVEEVGATGVATSAFLAFLAGVALLFVFPPSAASISSTDSLTKLLPVRVAKAL
mmetsp:Transcript_66245/g.130358  ORF Transcript_66245/g.130358 Transcript_66245/m.130358 type:complete len:202 (-) Transcript_66245:857-1462(-)